jgi:hypothetical protein
MPPDARCFPGSKRQCGGGCRIHKKTGKTAIENIQYFFEKPIAIWRML